jgi:tRNA modification GTPase
VNDTIAAISTPYGFGGIGVVRLSGPTALSISQRIFSKEIKKPRRAYFGFVLDPETREKIDTGIAIYFKSPHSYTGEDVVELQLHGGIKNLEYTLKLAIKKGARLAERGEFTKRAFLNGKLDLIEAQAVIELIEAKTEKAMKVASSRLFGEVSGKISKVKSRILSVISIVEGPIDFPFDVEPPSKEELREKMSDIRREVELLLSTYKSGKRIENGVKVSIVGKPNVGKSTLLNALLNFDRAIVSEVPGTTRDTVEETIDFFGVPVRLVDTAGMRETSDKIEKIGKERTVKAIENSDMVLFLFDASDEISDEDKMLEKLTEGKERIIVLNKTDLPSRTTKDMLKEIFRNEEIVQISALKKEGIDLLEQVILRRIAPVHEESVLITTEREKQSLEDAAKHLDKAISLNGKGMDELISEELKEAAISMGLLTGEEAPNEILNTIFSRFCIGK